MRLVFIYGPPASGKLTVATELSKLTGFKLFDNHVSIQFVRSVFEFGTKTFSRLTGKYRLEMLEEAAKEGVDVIFTFVYGKGEDDQFVKQVLQRVRTHGGRVCFVRLYCDRKKLIKRAKATKRKRMGKVSTEKLLNELFQRHDLESEIPFLKSLSIDTTNQSPRIAARSIAHQYKLRVFPKMH